MIGEKEKYALIGDSLDWAFMDLVVGLEPFYSARNPKPPTPTPPPMPTPPPEQEVTEESKIEPDVVEESTKEGANAGEDLKPDGGSELSVEPIEVPPPKEPTPPPPPPPPFEYVIDLPPEGAEVPYVKNYDGPPIETTSIEGQQAAEGVPLEIQLLAPESVAQSEGEAQVSNESVLPAENTPVAEPVAS